MILYIIETYPSVTERFISREITGLVQAGLNIQVLAFRKDPDAPEEVKTHYLDTRLSPANLFCIKKALFLIRNFKVALRLVPDKGFRSFIRLLKSLKLLWSCPEALAFIRQNKVVHLHAHFANMPTDLAMLLSRLAKVPFSFSSHAHDIYTQNPASIDKKLDAARFMVTCTCYNHKYFKNQLSDSNLHKINMIHHGIPLENWTLRPARSANPDFIQLLCVARLQEKKGLIYLCMAIKALVHQDVSVKLDIVGDGPLFDQLTRFIAENQLDEQIQLRGQVLPKEVRNYYEEADIFVLPSTTARNGDRDGLPNVLLEAMAMGIPVITTAFSGITELVIPEETGLTVPERNPKALAGSIIRLSSDRSLYNKLIINGRARVEQFNIDKSTLALNQLFIEHTS